MKLPLHHESDGPPCSHMESLLNQTADGSAKGLGRWYAIAHASRCGRCNQFLHRLEETLRRVRSVRDAEPTPEALKRLANGAWRTPPQDE